MCIAVKGLAEHKRPRGHIHQPGEGTRLKRPRKKNGGFTLPPDFNFPMANHCRLVFAEHKRLFMVAAEHSDQYPALKDVRSSTGILAHFHPELRAEVGDDGGRGSHDEFGDLEIADFGISAGE